MRPHILWGLICDPNCLQLRLYISKILRLNQLTHSPPLIAVVPYAISLDPDETLSDSASHPDPSRLTLSQHFYQLELGVPRNTCVTCPGSFRKLTRGITPKILMPELWILCIALDPLKLYQHMKFHLNSIN